MRRFVNENFDAAERLHSHQMKDLGPNTITHVLALAINQWRKAISRKQIIADAHSSHGLALADLVPNSRAGYTCTMSSFLETEPLSTFGSLPLRPSCAPNHPLESHARKHEVSGKRGAESV